MSISTNAHKTIDLHKSDQDIIRVEKREYRGREFIDIRQYYKDDNGVFRPTKKGITCSPDLLGRLIEVLKKMNPKIQNN